MTFAEQLNAYIEALGCTAKELARASGLSPSVISRYRSGSRAPQGDAGSLAALAGGVARLAEERGIPGLEEAAVAQALSAALSSPRFPYEALQENLNALLSALPVNVADFARHLNYDTSYISRIRSGQRRPADPEAFAAETARYIVRKYAEDRDRLALARLLGCPPEELSDDGVCLDKLTSWLSSGSGEQKDLIAPFLTRVDAFDLNEFIRSIHFDELKVPSMPFQLPASRNYYGLAEMRQGELDFFKTTVLSKSREPLIMMDDTPMADKTDGTDFKQKFIFAVALALKKGLHIHFIHNVNRPFEEMMMGLEGWIPLYMTGQVSSYYLKGVHNAVFGHLLFTGGTAALSGECIMGYHEHGKFYLTNNRAEFPYYRRRAEDLLSKASPLMDIYRSESENRYRAFLRTDAETPGSRRLILSAPPLYTLSQPLLEGMLARSGLAAGEQAQVLQYAARQREKMEELLLRDPVSVELSLLMPEEFAQHPLSLSLSELFFETDVLYSYEEYQAHLRQTEAYAAAHANYSVRCSSTQAFRNIQISILEGKWALISKNRAPAIHFVIRHPRLLEAMESFVPPSAGA